MTTPNYGPGVHGLLKRGWHEIPGVMASSVFAIVGLGLCGYSAYKRYHEPIAPKFKRQYIVYRSDDPRATAPERTFPL